MLLSATSNDVGVNVRLVGYGLSISRYQGIYSDFRVLAVPLDQVLPARGLERQRQRRLEVFLFMKPMALLPPARTT